MNDVRVHVSFTVSASCPDVMMQVVFSENIAHDVLSGCIGNSQV